MAWFEHDNVRIHYEEHGTGVPVLLMHGFTDSARRLAGLIDGLSPYYHVIAPDLRGYGRSTPQPRDYPVDHYQRDARDMAALLQHLGIERAHITGFSDGSEVALLIAIQNPELTRSVVAWGVSGSLRDIGAEVEEINSLVDENAPESKREWGEYVKNTNGVETGLAMARGWAEAARGIIAAGGDVSLSRAHEIQCPVLIVNGEDDQANPVPVVTDLAEQIANVELIILPGVGHPVHLERPEWFLQLMLDWLERH